MTSLNVTVYEQCGALPPDGACTCTLAKDHIGEHLHISSAGHVTVRWAVEPPAAGEIVARQALIEATRSLPPAALGWLAWITLDCDVHFASMPAKCLPAIVALRYAALGYLNAVRGSATGMHAGRSRVS